MTFLCKVVFLWALFICSSLFSMEQKILEPYDVNLVKIEEIIGLAESLNSPEKREDFSSEYCAYLASIGIIFDAVDERVFRTHKDFTTYWRAAYIYAMKAFQLSQQDKFLEAIEFYEKQIASLKSISDELLETNLVYSKIISHTIAKAFYEIGVAYTKLHKSKTFEDEIYGKEDDDSDEQSVEQSSLLYLNLAKNAYESGLTSYHADLPVKGPGCLPKKFFHLVKKSEQNLFDAFNQGAFVKSRMAALFLNKGDIEEALADEAGLDDAPVADFKLNFEHAYNLIKKDPTCDEALKAHINAQYKYFYAKKPAKAKKRKSTKRKREEVVPLANVKFMPWNDALDNFVSRDLDAFAESQPESIRLRPHQLNHLRALQEKLSMPNTTELGVISSTGSGKTMVMKAFTHLLYPSRDEMNDYRRLAVITVVPTLMLVEQDMAKTHEYREKGLSSLSAKNLVSKWCSTAIPKRIKPHTVITYDSLVRAANDSVAAYPTRGAFERAVRDNPEARWSDKNLFFSPFNESVIFWDEAHTSESATRKATYARYRFPNKQETINRFFEHRAALKAESKDGPALMHDVSPITLKDIEALFADREATKSYALNYSTTATPSESHENYFPIDSAYSISQAIEDGVSPPLQVLRIKIKDESLISSLRRNLKLEEDLSGEFSARQQKTINEFLAEQTGPFNFALAKLMQSLEHKKSILFAPTVNHVCTVTTAFRQVFEADENFYVESMHGNNTRHGIKKTPKQNAAAEKRFKENERGILLNCQMVRLGSDFPGVDVVFESRVYKRAKAAVVQAAGRCLRKKELGESAKYIWLDLDIGQLDPLAAIFGEDHPSHKPYKFPSSMAQEDVEGILIGKGELPDNIEFDKPIGKEGDFFSVTLPNGQEVIYDYDGEARVPVPRQDSPLTSSAAPKRKQPVPFMGLPPWAASLPLANKRLRRDSVGMFNEHAAGTHASDALSPWRRGREGSQMLLSQQGEGYGQIGDGESRALELQHSAPSIGQLPPMMEFEGIGDFPW